MIILGVVCFCLMVLVGYLNLRQDIERNKWAEERSELITRIQHPEIISPPKMERGSDMDYQTAPEPDDIDLVGTVRYGD